MSAIGGIYNFDGGRIPEELLCLLGNRLNSRGPDGGDAVSSNSIGMVYRAFHTNKESRLASQPLVSQDKHLLAWDGRLDNREELISLLGDDLQDSHTDVSIVMAAYLKWGTSFPHQLIGDFAFSLWDPRHRTLLLARDPIGPRTLYYHVNKKRIIWSTELRPLLEVVGIEFEINEEYIADLQTRLPDPSQTPYQNILAVPPAHVISLTNDTMQTTRFWSLNPDHEIRYKHDADYEEHFLELFRQAVRCRLRVEGVVWAELSGGLDSSSIVCMAHDIISKGEASASGIETASLILDSTQMSDEGKSILLVEDSISKHGHHLREHDHPILTPPARDSVPVLPNPFANFSEYYGGLNTTMREENGRVLLSGRGGDEILGGVLDPAPELTDLFLQFKFRHLHTQVRGWSEQLHKSRLQTIWRKAILPTLPRQLRRILKRTTNDQVLLLYAEEFVTRMKMSERRRGPTDEFNFASRTGRSQSRWFARIVREIASGFGRELSDADITYPFTHRPLVEFMQAIPFSQRVRPGETKSLLRRSMHKLLPPEILARRQKILNTEAAMRAVRREWPRLQHLFTDATICRRGYVNPRVLSSLLEQARQGTDPSCLSLLYLVQLEYWLRSFESGALKQAASLPRPQRPSTQFSLEPDYVGRT